MNMNKNVVQKIKIVQDVLNVNDLIDKVKSLTNTIDKVYSYLLCKSADEYLFLINIYEISKFNTIDIKDILLDLYSLTPEDTAKSTIKFRQPSIELMMDVYKNYVYTLAIEQLHHWQDLELDDLLQIGNICIFNLSRKGYYIHKQLLRQTYMNMILQLIRKDKHKPAMMSIDAVINFDEGESNGEQSPLAYDNSFAEQQDEQMDKDVRDEIIADMRALVQIFITPRQYDQLIREYSNKMTTTEGRKKVNDLKNKLKKLGYDVSIWRRYY